MIKLCWNVSASLTDCAKSLVELIDASRSPSTVCELRDAYLPER